MSRDMGLFFGDKNESLVGDGAFVGQSRIQHFMTEAKM
jgi:hypothetical protein